MWTLFELPDRGRFLLLFAVGFLNVLFVLFVLFVVMVILLTLSSLSELPSEIRQEDITRVKPRGQDPGEEDPIDEVAVEGEGVELGAAY